VNSERIDVDPERERTVMVQRKQKLEIKEVPLTVQAGCFHFVTTRVQF
jgi:hypothetical protein